MDPVRRFFDDIGDGEWDRFDKDARRRVALDAALVCSTDSQSPSLLCRTVGDTAADVAEFLPTGLLHFVDPPPVPPLTFFAAPEKE